MPEAFWTTAETVAYDSEAQMLFLLLLRQNNNVPLLFDDVKKIIHNAHIFDYMRHLVNDGHRMLTISDVNKTSIDWLLKHMLSNDT